MQGSVTNLILEKLGELGEIALESFFPKKYAYTRISRRLFGLDTYPKASPQTLASMLSRLQRQGLVIRRGKRRRSSWALTQKGKRRVEKIRQSQRRDAPPPDGVTRLVIFDIPERERKKRDMLRAELLGCDFEGLQRSVWMGKRPLPKEFIMFLDALRLKNKVHIFSVREHGTLER